MSRRPVPRGLVCLAGDGPAQGVDPLVGLPDLAVDQAQAFADGADVGAGGLDGSWSDADGLRAGCQARWQRRTCAIRLAPRSLAISRARRAFSGVGTRQRSRNQSAATSSLTRGPADSSAGAARAAGWRGDALLAQLLGHAGPLSSTRAGAPVSRRRKQCRSVPQRVAQHKGVAAVVLGAGHGEAVAEAVELLGVDEKAAKPRSQGVDQPCGTSMAAAIAAGWAPPVATSQSRDRRAPLAVGKRALPKDHADGPPGILMRLGRPRCRRSIRSRLHRLTPPSRRRDAHHSLYCALSGANSPPGLRHGRPTGARVPPRCSRHRGNWVAPGGSARSGKSTGSWCQAAE